MRSLEDFMHIAAARGAEQVVLQTGQPPLMGSELPEQPVGEVVRDEELSEALRTVLTDEEQVDLAVGNVVEFELDLAGATWSFVTDPRADGIVVRARRRGAGDPVETTDSGDLLAGIDVPMVQVELEEDDSAPPISSGSRWAKFEVPVDTGEIDLGAADVEDTSPRWPSEIGIEQPEGEAPPGSSGVADGADPEPAAEPGPPAGRDEAPDGAPELSFELQAPGRTPTPAPRVAVAPTLQDVEPAAGSSADPANSARPPAIAPPAAPAPALASADEARATWADELRQHAELIEPGTLVYLRARGLAEAVAQALGVPCHVIDAAGGTRAWRAVSEDPQDGAVVIIRDLDPSRHLGRALRSLEEGARVVVETRARTPEGARRVLLGLDASERAERWLDAHPQRWFELSEGGWRVQ